MIEHVYRRAKRVPGVDQVVVLTDDPRIEEVVAGFGGDCEMTPTDCVSGTDRIAFALERWLSAGRRVDAVLNIQGDEPFIDPEAVGQIASHLIAAPRAGMATLAAPLPPELLNDPNAVKVVTRQDGDALYFSRAGIPYPRDAEACAPRLHIGVYGYSTDILRRLAKLAPSPLERAESLEQLRALEHGIPIRVFSVDEAWRGIDTVEDLQAAVEHLASQSASQSSTKAHEVRESSRNRSDGPAPGARTLEPLGAQLSHVPEQERGDIR